MLLLLPGHIAVVELLLAAGADINAKNKQGETMLYSASAGNHMDVIQILIDAGIDVNSKSTESNTALMLAASEGHSKIVKVLLAAGADHKVKEEKGGKTAHSMAEGMGFTKVVEILRAHDEM